MSQQKNTKSPIKPIISSPINKKKELTYESPKSNYYTTSNITIFYQIFNNSPFTLLAAYNFITKIILNYI